ncbi:hypothetical protein KY495_11670 [Massilia sp. PAMC28688]|uniref:hypothetical protein n=1 Tax=Massilia sp. PAMC28688 TaxID=2861283 RepID=UPI001C627A75|nr:hypothetical protein [Massilia sp. PAMC28688]QYF95748.1 hypothetical protein KY495_11670 [Massilia sp. PAMC28688]
MTNYAALLSILLLASGCNAADQTSAGQAKPGAAPATAAAPTKCTSEPCGNTASGEDPQEVALRKANQARDALAASGTDQQRWVFPLFSDTTDPARLQMDVVKAAGFKMRLLPQKGHLVFERPGAVDTFEIAPKELKESTCPQYGVSVIAAGASYALIKKNCPLTEYKPNRYAMTSEYYLYDANSAVMRSVWAAHSGSKDEKFPAAKPAPTIKKVADGYQFSWAGIWPNDPAQKKVEIRNKYSWKANKAGKTELLCTDLTAPKDEALENEMCEGGILPLVSSVRK